MKRQVFNHLWWSIDSWPSKMIVEHFLKSGFRQSTNDSKGFILRSLGVEMRGNVDRGQTSAAHRHRARRGCSGRFAQLHYRQTFGALELTLGGYEVQLEVLRRFGGR